MRSELSVDIPAVRSWATALRRTGGRMEADPPSPGAGPVWSCTAANAAAVDAAQRILSLLTDDIAGISAATLATMDDYEAADDRAAAALRRVR
ncbi:hypothetical protein [Actinoplanes sp. RD1]|uniref:hypothetical protein n=1 Tax=Actinoplanes sp. RD1 TaxID=3064538 RepID=UPI002741DF1B|nr:hypothetical protein [Actinoplanes sp. RD1]